MTLADLFEVLAAACLIAAAFLFAGPSLALVGAGLFLAYEAQCLPDLPVHLPRLRIRMPRPRLIRRRPGREAAVETTCLHEWVVEPVKTESGTANRVVCAKCPATRI